MYVRWKKRARTAYHKPTGDHTLVAMLAQSRRVNGQPRQKTIYLAAIREKHLSATAHQLYFWRRVDQRLDDLALDGDLRAAIETKLRTTVPRPTQDAIEQVQRDRRRLGLGAL